MHYWKNFLETSLSPLKIIKVKFKEKKGTIQLMIIGGPNSSFKFGIPRSHRTLFNSRSLSFFNIYSHVQRIKLQPDIIITILEFNDTLRYLTLFLFRAFYIIK